MTTLRADVCVIGSGAGGAPVAKELACAGARVVVLEDGPDVGPEELTARPRDMIQRLYRQAGQLTTIGTPPIVLPLGRAIGGTTLVNSGTCFRTPEHVLARWETERGLEGLAGAGLDGCFERVEREIGVARVPPEIAGRNALIAQRGAQALGWSSAFLRRNAVGCVGSGVCAFGCPTGAKQHMGVTYIPRARAAGATVVAGARATRIIVERRRARGVEATTVHGPLHVEAPTVVVAAGALHTPGLLAASGLGAESGQLGRNLSIHPATAVWGLFDERVDMARGVPQSFYVDEFADRGVMLEGIAGPPDYVAMAAPFSGPRQRELMLRYPHLAQFGAMISDTARGRIVGGRLGRALGAPLVRYDVNEHDAATAQFAIERLMDLLWAAGARTVITPLARARELRDPSENPLRGIRVRPRELKLMAFHPLGSAGAHADPRRGVVDGHLRVHRVHGVYVADGSAVPTALGVNPQLTIMALATRLAFHLLNPREEAPVCPS
jgi:choline dehydrogenase-like flavoprotein